MDERKLEDFLFAMLHQHDLLWAFWKLLDVWPKVVRQLPVRMLSKRSCKLVVAVKQYNRPRKRFEIPKEKGSTVMYGEACPFETFTISLSWIIEYLYQGENSRRVPAGSKYVFGVRP